MVAKTRSPRRPRPAPAPEPPGYAQPDDTGPRFALWLSVMRQARLVRHVRACVTCTHAAEMGTCLAALEIAISADQATADAEKTFGTRGRPKPPYPGPPAALF